jgi:hypothetical protein
MPALVPTLVYLLCFLTSLACAVLLGRSYASTRARMLLWSAVCFGFLALANLFVMFDMLVFPDISLRSVRLWLSLAAVAILLFGFIWDQDD